jgi:hypothetical protein
MVRFNSVVSFLKLCNRVQNKEDSGYDLYKRQYSTIKIIELIKIMAMLTFTLMLLVLAIIPPASKAIAEASNRTCALDM